MFFRNRRLDNIANLDDGPLEFELCIFGAGLACRQKLRYGTAAFQDDYSLSGGLHTVENREASSLEIGCVDGLHLTRLLVSARGGRFGQVSGPMHCSHSAYRSLSGCHASITRSPSGQSYGKYSPLIIRKNEPQRGLGSSMSLKADTPTAPATLVPSATEAAREPDAVEYPERQWIAQSVWHGDAVLLATAALRNRFRDQEDVLVAMELAVYYQRGDDTAWLQPDVQVVFGVGRGENRSTYKVWEEGKPPDFVLEVASPSTQKHDARYKAREYSRIGVLEYWRLDPEGTLMGTALEGYAATGGSYAPIEAVERPGGGRLLRSRVLGLDLRSRKRDGATVLVFTDPVTGEEFDGEVEEAERRRRIAEDRADAERERANTERERADTERVRADAERDRANAAEDRVRALEERLGNLPGRTRPSGLDS